MGVPNSLGFMGVPNSQSGEILEIGIYGCPKLHICLKPLFYMTERPEKCQKSTAAAIVIGSRGSGLPSAGEKSEIFLHYLFNCLI